jgi:hypothetical protein
MSSDRAVVRKAIGLVLTRERFVAFSEDNFPREVQYSWEYGPFLGYPGSLVLWRLIDGQSRIDSVTAAPICTRRKPWIIVERVNWAGARPGCVDFDRCQSSWVSIEVETGIAVLCRCSCDAKSRSAVYVAHLISLCIPTREVVLKYTSNHLSVLKAPEHFFVHLTKSQSRSIDT